MKWVLATFLVLALSGCAQDEPVAEPVPATPNTVQVAGIVQDPAVQPIAGATVTIVQLNLTQTTGADGRFSFEVPFGFYVVRADAANHGSANLTVNPNDLNELLFVLQRNVAEPYHLTVPFSGFLECAAEYLIITPSCDSLTEELHDRGTTLPNNGSVVDNVSEFEVTADPGWQTIVVDLVFDLSNQPGLEAMRATVSGSDDPNALTAYEQYGRFESPESFTFRLEPGGEYAEGVVPMPDGSAALRFSIYGQGHGWHATCEATCLLGVGVGLDVAFELFVTTFYVDAAPAGWSLQA